jgi:hypothetical protein
MLLSVLFLSCRQFLLRFDTLFDKLLGHARADHSLGVSADPVRPWHFRLAERELDPKRFGIDALWR